MTTSSWGIERDVVKHRELFTIPFIIENFTKQNKQTLISLLDNAIKNQSHIPFSDNLEIENNIKTEVLQPQDLDFMNLNPYYISSLNNFTFIKHLMFDFTKSILTNV
ncbi:MAG: hypothetical protein LBV72_16615 [Tannerella sp.]|jgi:hypothetical protein|nr:hypothetical protein [Tannerella sp.]